MADADPHPSEPGLQADQRLVDRGWLRIGAGLAIAGQAMVFSFAVNLSEAEGWSYYVVHGVLILSAVATLAFLGGDLIRSAWDSLRDRRIGIDLLFLVTLAGAFAGSLVSTVTHTGSVYYEVVAILVVVHTAGKMLGARSRVAALRAVTSTRASFDQCDVVQDSGIVRRSVADLPAGARVRVAPGGAVAVDGTIVEGRGYLQETSMTGEWQPVSRGPGDPVLAGTYSIDGSFEIVASGGPRRLDGILAEVERARLAPSALQAQADRLMAWFLPLVVGASAITFAGWIAVAPWERALFNAMAVLLVACPCAMGLATPVAVWGGLARLAQYGLIARTGDFLDRLAKCDTMCLDKTGTLSGDSLEVKGWTVAPEFSGREGWLAGAVAAIETGLKHPVASALVRGYTGALPPISDRQIVPGLGVIARVGTEHGGRCELRVGENALMPAEGRETSTTKEAGAKSVSVFVDGVFAASIEVSEHWREGWRETLQELGTLGLRVEVLSGDPRAEEALSGLVNSLGLVRPVAVRSGLTPHEKKMRIEELSRTGASVGFAGDGINDAAALSVCDAGIALRSGTDLARASAMAVVVGDDLRVLPVAVRVARQTRRSIHTNLLFAAGYNILGMALAAAGVLHPVVAALLMVGSSVVVSLRALRSVESRR
ncbi:cation-transporting P-type ATPase [Opitutaceae bacterium EW11]|nr:cation-transporting P-type ATPase [Opitutaceae bacterium EW11]